MSPTSRRRGPKSPSSAGPAAAPGERLQKVLAAAGVASRRECETLILEGRVEVDGVPVTELGSRVHPATQHIRVDGTPLARPRHVYYLVNKPPGVVSTTRDPNRRIRVIDLVPEDARLFTIGRLDRSSEGLIIVTNDGEVANLLTHPRYGIAKTYRATVMGFPAADALDKLRSGVHLAEGVARVAELRVKGRHARGAELEIVLTEGRNREIRRMLARVGHKVLRLRRVAVGPLRLGNLAVGEARRLTGHELQQLRTCLRQARARAEGTSVPGDSPPTRKVRAPARGRTPAGRGQAARQDGPPKGRRPQSRIGTGGSGPAKTKRPAQTKRPRAGTVLDYDRSRSSDAEKPSRPKRAGKGKRPS